MASQENAVPEPHCHLLYLYKGNTALCEILMASPF